MLYRKIESLIEEHLKSDSKKILLIDGARQIGKTYIINHVGKKLFENYIEINMIADSLGDRLFENTKTVEDFYLQVSMLAGNKMKNKENTLIFIDEIQAYPHLLTLLKFLSQDNKFTYIASGSLLGVTLSQTTSIPMGSIRKVRMFPLDFEEFLWAMGDEATYPLIRHCFEAKQPLGTALHRKIMNDFRQYILVGGMPQSVLAYMNGKDFEASDVAKRRILKLYHEDVAKFAEGYEDKVFAVFDGIPGQLSKKEKKYKLSSLGKQARFRTYEDSFVWLNEAMIVNTCFNATDPHVGLALSADNATQKCYMADTGLLVTHTFQDKKYTDNELYRAILFDKLNINEGMLMENIVAQMLRHSRSRLYFYSRSDSQNRENHMEIDFLITEGKKIAPVEVKSGNYRSHSSLDKFRKHFSSVIGNSYILYTKDVMIKDGIIHLPLYMAELL